MIKQYVWQVSVRASGLPKSNEIQYNIDNFWSVFTEEDARMSGQHKKAEKRSEVG